MSFQKEAAGYQHMMRALEAAARALSKMPAGAAKTRAAGEILTSRIPRAMLNADVRGSRFIKNIPIPVPERYRGKLLDPVDKMQRIRNAADRALTEWNDSLPYWPAGSAAFNIPKKTVTQRTDHNLFNVFRLPSRRYFPGWEALGIKPRWEHPYTDRFMRDAYSVAVSKNAWRARPFPWHSKEQYDMWHEIPRLGQGVESFYVSQRGKNPYGKLFHIVRESMKNTV